jgi:hypothetical protein
MAAGDPDVVSLDVPLLIRILEWAREEAQADVPLHFVAERLSTISAGGKPAGMSDYDAIING